MKKLKIFISLIILCLVGFIVLLQFKYNLSSDQRYLKELGIYGINSTTITEMINDDKYRKIIKDDNVIICCDGFNLIAVKANENYVGLRIEVFDRKYKFGRNRIGIGSSKENIEMEARGKKTIKDLPENEYGYIVDSLWIHYYFDADGKAERILMYYGP